MWDILLTFCLRSTGPHLRAAHEKECVPSQHVSAGGVHFDRVLLCGHNLCALRAAWGGIFGWDRLGHHTGYLCVSDGLRSCVKDGLLIPGEIAEKCSAQLMLPRAQDVASDRLQLMNDSS